MTREQLREIELVELNLLVRIDNVSRVARDKTTQNHVLRGTVVESFKNIKKIFESESVCPQCEADWDTDNNRCTNNCTTRGDL